MGNKLWRTPIEQFEEWDRLYGPFTIDAAADGTNALLPRYCTAETDGRRPEHYRNGDRVYCNPPYVGLVHWLETAWLTSRTLDDVSWLLVLPVSTDAKWFHKYVWNRRAKRSRDGVELDFPPGRVHFIDPEARGRDDPRAPTMLVNFRPREELS